MSLKMSFWVRPSQKNQDRKSPIYLRLQLDGVRTEYSIGQYVLLSAWDSKGQKVKGLNNESMKQRRRNHLRSKSAFFL